MISRHWKGIAKRELADAYIAHLKSDTFPKLASLEGFVRASILRREVPSGTEFQIVTVWSSLQAIHAFAGADIETAVVPPTINYETPDPLCDLDYVPNRSRVVRIRHALFHSHSLGGHLLGAHAAMVMAQFHCDGAP